MVHVSKIRNYTTRRPTIECQLTAWWEYRPFKFEHVWEGGGCTVRSKLNKCLFLVRRTGARTGGSSQMKMLRLKIFCFVFMYSGVGNLAARRFKVMSCMQFKVYWKLKETSIMIQFVQMLQSANIADIVHESWHNFVCEICQKTFNRIYTCKSTVNKVIFSVIWTISVSTI